jgi:predicted nucleic acid-binding protein
MTILDTSFFIDLFRRDAGATAFWNSLRSSGAQASYSSITVFELWLGRLRQDEEQFYDAMMQVLRPVPFGISSARLAGTWLRSFPRQVAERLLRDSMVAAIAFELGETVCTRNVRDFQRFSGVKVESY